jgi:sulfate transport system substrate-binding protein
VVFLVRKGNPQKIHDWNDLLKPGVQVIASNPKTSSGGRWAYLAAWAQAAKRPGGSDSAARAYVKDLYKHVPVLDTGARGSTITFAQRGIGDVLLSWENEAYLAQEEFGRDKFEIVNPSASILAEPTVAVVDKNVDQHGVRKVAEAYLKGLYAESAQELIARHHYRPTDPRVAARHAAEFPNIRLYTVNDAFGGWASAQKRHFADGGEFDRFQTKQ